MKKYIGFIIILICFAVLSYNNVVAAHQGDGKKGKTGNTGLQKVGADPSATILDINNITSWINDNGLMPPDVGQSWNGTFPKGTAGAIYAEGIVWGGFVNDGTNPRLRVGGNTYSSGTTKLTRIVRVRPDYQTADLTNDAANFNVEPIGAVTAAQIASLKAQYAKDWNEWPWQLGAPYEDVNHDGKYDPTVDIPGVPGASQTIWLQYDDRNSSDLYGSPSIGLTISETLWGYSYSGALGNITFRKVDLAFDGTSTAASNATIDSMYIVAWADPDVGTYSDDFAGCDTTLNLGYAYNGQASDATYTGEYGLVPPAVGYDFFQGVSHYTGNPADTVIYDLKYRTGWKYVNRKPLSSFIYFSLSGQWQDPDFDYNGTLQWYNMMRGYKPRPFYPAAEAFPSSVADYTPEGVYLLDGNPLQPPSATNKIDGVVDPKSDRRIVNVTGPFTMSLHDTAEIVIALVGGIGSDYLNSVTTLKTNDLLAQQVYDNLFVVPSIPTPNVQTTALDNKIILNWGFDPAAVAKVENTDIQGYSFQGYDVYQLPSSSSTLEDGVLLERYDKVDGITQIFDTVYGGQFNEINIPVLVEKGSDNGITRNMTLTTDQLTHLPFRNGQEYYFAVVAYAYNPAPAYPFHTVKSPVQIKTVIPQMPNPGIRYNGISGDTLATVHTSTSGALSNGFVYPVVVDPTKVTGDHYIVTFDSAGWNLTDSTKNKVLLTGQTNQLGDGNYLIIDGIQTKVQGPNLGINTIEETDANDVVVDGAVGRIPPSLGTTGYIVTNRNGAVNGAYGDRTFDRFLEWGSDDVIIDFTKTSLTWDYITETVHIDQSTGQPYRAPFAVFRRTATGNMIRLFAGFWDTDTSGTWNVDGSWFDPNYDKPCFEPIYCWQGYDASGNEINYDTTNDAQYVIDNDLYTSAHSTFGSSTGEFQYPFVTATLFAMYSAGATPPYGHKVVFITNKPNTSADKFSYTAPTVSSSTDLAKSDVEKIQVFPNPYYGFNYREVSRSQHYVTFSHLPNKATIRIFDLAGVQVNKIDKNDATQFAKWYLVNQNNLPVASGIYVAYIDMPDLGVQKILKLAIVQEQQILPVY